MLRFVYFYFLQFINKFIEMKSLSVNYGTTLISVDHKFMKSLFKMVIFMWRLPVDLGKYEGFFKSDMLFSLQISFSLQGEIFYVKSLKPFPARQLLQVPLLQDRSRLKILKNFNIFAICRDSQLKICMLYNI